MGELSAEQLFIRGIWASVIPDALDTSWVDRAAAQPSDDGPLGDYATLVHRMLESGIPSRDIARFAQIVGYETAFATCYHLEDATASFEDFGDSAANEAEWGLFATDPASGAPLRPMSGLHERLLMGDPSGREMRPSP